MQNILTRTYHKHQKLYTHTSETHTTPHHTKTHTTQRKYIKFYRRPQLKDGTIKGTLDILMLYGILDCSVSISSGGETRKVKVSVVMVCVSKRKQVNLY